MQSVRKKTINKLIAADDLHWCEEEKRYVSLSDEEINNIILVCIEQDITREEDVYKVVQWAGQVRIGNILLNNFLNNRIKISSFDENEPYFTPK